MLTTEERKELNALVVDEDVDEDVKAYFREVVKNRYPVSKEKKKLYQYRWMKKKGAEIRAQQEND